jgi:outer membrane receptor protein involved in Fe transport
VTAVERATPLVRATGYEAGTRQKWSPTLITTAALWALNIDSELVFAGDAGTTEASRPSRRKGIELTANWRPIRGWEIDADAAITRARFADNQPIGDRIPGAMERVVTLGATYGNGPLTFGARLRHFGSHPLIEDNSIRAAASTLANVKTSWKLNSSAEISLEIFNLFNRQLSDIEYAYASRLPGEPAFSAASTPATVHFHPSLPRSVRLGIKLSL